MSEEEKVIANARSLGSTHAYHTVGGVFLGVVIYLVGNFLLKTLEVDYTIGFLSSMVLGIIASVVFRTAPKE